MLPSLAGPLPPRKTLRPPPDVRLPPLLPSKLPDPVRERIGCLQDSPCAEDAQAC